MGWNTTNTFVENVNVPSAIMEETNHFTGKDLGTQSEKLIQEKHKV